MLRASLLILIIILTAACAETPPTRVETESQASDSESGPVATAPPAATDLSFVEPWGPDGLKPEHRVIATVEGSCFAGALKSARTDAWRCSFERDDPDLGRVSQILDPCLENPIDADSPLACVSGGGEVTLLNAVEALPREFANLPHSETLPLTITLDNGELCELATGATITVEVEGEPQRVNYLCGSGGVLIGEPNDADAIWTIHYSADPRGQGDIFTMGIASATAFRGSTANSGWSSGTDRAGALQRVLPDLRPRVTRLVFDFGEGGLPDYEIGYVNESIVDDGGNAVALDGEFKLRVWFLYPSTESPAFPGDRRIPIDPDANVNETALARDGRGSQMWYIGLDRMSGFQARRDEDRGQLLLDIYDPDPLLSIRPVVGVGSGGGALQALTGLLVAKGYLEEPPADGRFSEAVRKAVVAFEAANGLVPDGVVGPDTWAALERPLPPPRSGTSTRYMTVGKTLPVAQQDEVYVTPAGDIEVYVRSGPSLDYPPIGSLLPGQTAEVIGQLPGSSPETSWWEVCCVNGQSGWVRADVVNVIGGTPDVAAAEPPPAQGPGGIDPANRPTQTAEGDPILYFTFDDGPSEGSTETVADLMTDNGGRGTFFAIGRQVDWTPQIAATVARNHTVQNHTYNHAALDTLSRPDFFNEVEQTQNAILQATNTLPTCLRPPYGATDGTTFQMAAELGLDVVLWTVDTQDWMMPGVDAIVDHIMTNATPGAIILMHDGGGDRTQTIEALRIALPRLRQQGYVFEALCG